jgi:carbon storage regulator
MLVLSRYRDESIYIGDDIIITVVDIRGDRVRIGIQAPPNVSVHRQEVYDAIKSDHESGIQRTVRETAQETPKPPAAEKLPSTLKQVLEQRKNPKPLPLDMKNPFGFGDGLAEIIGH